jgi:hypothetical protein
MNPYLNGSRDIYIYSLEPCRFYRKEGLKSHLLSTTLTRHIITPTYTNETVSMASLLRDPTYTYEYRKIISSI